MTTILDLFKAAGYEDYEKMEINKAYSPKRAIEILSYDATPPQNNTIMGGKASKSFEYKKVNSLFYKGKSKGYKVQFAGVDRSFLCTGSHAFLCHIDEPVTPKNVSIQHCEWRTADSLGSFFWAVSENSGYVKAFLTKTNEEFPVLDVEVADTSCYVSNGIVSHNSFGGSAKLMSEALRKFNPLLEKYKTSMFMISQERDNIGSNGYGPDYKVTGGRAIKFYASNRSRVQRVDYIKEKGIITGIQMRVKNEKNKAGIPYREAQLTLDFEKGFDINNEYMDFIISLGIAEQKGAWFYMPQYGLEKANGRDAVQDWLNHHPDEYAKVKLEVNTQLTGDTVLDQDNAPPPDDEFEEPPEILPEAEA